MSVPSWYSEECQRAQAERHKHYRVPPRNGEDVVVKNAAGFLTLAWHELSHYLKEQNSRLARIENGKGEEAALYFIPIQLLARAGLRPEEGYYTWAKLLHSPDGRITLPALIDLHPSEPLSESVLEKALANAVAHVRTPPAQLEHFDDRHPFTGAVLEARHHSFVAYCLERRGYAQAQDVPAQLRILNQVFSDISDSQRAHCSWSSALSRRVISLR